MKQDKPLNLFTQLANRSERNWSQAGFRTAGDAVEERGPGIDASIAAGFELQSSGGEPNALHALAAEIPPGHRERGLAPVILEQIAAIGRSAGFTALIAPVRPNWKERYRLTPAKPGRIWPSPSPALTSSRAGWLL
jgi:hypothetical protein